MACKGFNMLLQIDTFKDGIYFSPTKKVYLCSKGAQDSWALAYYYYKKKKSKKYTKLRDCNLSCEIPNGRNFVLNMHV